MDFKRKIFNRLFKFLCYFAAGFSVFSLVVIIGSLFYLNINSFRVCNLHLPLKYSESQLEFGSKHNSYENIFSNSLAIFADDIFARSDKVLSQQEIVDLLYENMSSAALLIVHDYIDVKSDIAYIPVKDQNKSFIELFDDHISWSWRKSLFTNNNSFFADIAGLRGAILGSVFIVLVVMFFAVPLGLLTAIYLVEFAPKNRFTIFLEIVINNLASIPSIIFGLFGLSILVNFMHLPYASALVGGIVMSILVLPMIVISSKNALLNVPRSIYNCSFVLGASKIQTIFYQVLPIAIPEIVAGVLIAILRAIGETAPLLLIGMVVFISDISFSPLGPVSVVPVQIYQWFSLPDEAFLSLATSAIIFLMLVILIFNAIINAVLGSKRIYQ